MDFDALRVRRGDERLQGVESGGDRLVHWESRPEAEAVAPPHDLGDDGVRVRRLGVRDERVDLRLVVYAFAESIRPKGAELAGRCRLPERRYLRREGGEQTSQVPQDSRKRGEFQSFPFLYACNGPLTASLRVALDRVKRPSMRCGQNGTVVLSPISTFGQ